MGGGGGESAQPAGKGGKRRTLKKTKIEIIPMIDTMFFLLVFFILSSVGVIKLQGININLPKEASSTTPTNQAPPKELMVVIDKNRNEFVDALPVGRSNDTKPLLRREIQKIYGDNPDLNQVLVVISADPTVPHGQVVSCIDDARALQIDHFAIATKEDSDAQTAGGGAATKP